MKKLAVIAFGGNALLRGGQKGTYKEQMQNVTETCQSLLPFLKGDYNIVIGHGNGPQVGNVMLQQEAGSQNFDVPGMPVDFCVAETQGLIGFMIEMGLNKVFAKENIKRNVVTLVTQVEVDKNDPMFQNPTKPVGPYYSKEDAERYAAETGAVYKEDPKGRGWRKVVASPKPIAIQNVDIVQRLAIEGNIVVTVGGGGIPVVDKDNKLVGIVTNRDLRFQADMNRKIDEVMTKENLVVTHQQADLESAQQILLEHKIEKLPVVDDVLLFVRLFGVE